MSPRGPGSSSIYLQNGVRRFAELQVGPATSAGQAALSNSRWQPLSPEAVALNGDLESLGSRGFVLHFNR